MFVSKMSSEICLEKVCCYIMYIIIIYYAASGLSIYELWIKMWAFGM